jgi:hypothetical protein
LVAALAQSTVKGGLTSHSNGLLDTKLFKMLDSVMNPPSENIAASLRASAASGLVYEVCS